MVYTTLCETVYCGSLLSLFECCINQCISVLQCWEQLALRCRATAQRRSQPHTDCSPCFALPCSTATQPLSALTKPAAGQVRCAPGGRYWKWWNLLKVLLLAPHSILPACLGISLTRAQVHASTRRAAGKQTRASSEKCQGKAEAARQQCCEQCLISALIGLLLN